ncbi:MAG TPA: PAS domain S-box protein, partial [Bacteroidia bacterium]|nr:PAS domain S-box protein [Bacteroidia bacterium]
DTNEWTYIQKNNKHITVLLSVSSIRGADNEITGYLGVARNITKQKEIEKSYQKSEERYKNMVERSTNVIYKTNQKGEFIFVNQVAEGLTGYTSKELLKKKYTDLIRPDKKTEAIVFYTKQVQDKIPSTYYEFPIITKGGKEKWIGQSVQLTEMDHDKTEFTALAIDITERINYEKLLVLQKEKYQNIITNMNLGMLEVDNEGRIQFANPGFTLISGYTYDELIGKKATDMFVERPHLKIVKGKLNQRAKGIADMYEIPVRNKRGEPRWWMISGAPNFDEKGNLIGSIGIHLDITDQKKIELELASAKSKAEESSRAKEAFLSNMSHEIRTPLNAIIGMIRELSKENLSEKQYKYVKNTYIASQHLLSVLNNVLDISKIDAGELQLDLHNFNLLSTLNDIKTIMMAKAAEKGLYLQLDQLEDKNICVYGDSGRFRQILLNLVGNAIKFTETGGINISYKVEIKHKGFKTISIWVKDTGVGMEEEFVKKIFNRFTQEDSSTSRKYGGSGLGMAITYELIQLMNGTIEVKSKKGEGTTVEMKFLLPIGDPTKLVENTPIYLSSMTEHLDILLVEDNEFNRMVAMDTLKYYNCNVTEAENGEQAIEILKKGRKFDVILMDLQMPVMNGFDATVIIRNELKLKIPIIALTANAFKSELEECIRIGMDDYVTKPFEDERLLNTIYKFVAAPVGDLKKKPKVNTPLDESALYSLDRINAMSRDDKTYIMKMVSIFIEQAETSVSQIKSAYRKKDLELVYQIAHRIKPSIDGMGITSLKETIRTVEKLTKEKNDSVDLGKRIEFLCTTLQEVVIQLNKL